jgi:hypothetical protein
VNGVAPPKSETVPASRWRQGDQSRPWSALEVEERLEAVLDALANALDLERELAVEAADAEAAYRLAKALCFVQAEGRNAQEREERAYLLMEEQSDGLNPRQARDQAQALYRSQRGKVAQLQTEARVSHTLLVDARDSKGLVR